jgi:serine protease Do
VEPAVVNISTTQVLEKRQSLNRKRRQVPNPNGDQDDPMQDFFDRFFDGRGQDAPPAAERSLGSGVIVDRKGFILTNNHVVEQATKIQVQLNGSTQRYNAKVIGTDEETDLAVIKIDAGNKELPVAKLGNSDGVQVGDWVLAIGSPFGFERHGYRRHCQRQGSRRRWPPVPKVPADLMRRSIRAIPAVRWWTSPAK